MPRRRACALAAMVFLSSAASAGPNASQAMRGRLAGWADVDASGRVVTFAPDGGAVPSVARALRDELAKQVFTPARDASGAAHPVRTYLSGRYVLEPDSEGWVLRIDELRAGPKVVSVVMPRAHDRMFTMGETVWMRVAMTVQPDGRPADIEIEEFQGTQATRREARDALRKWRFEPETVAGEPIATRVRQEYSMWLKEQEAPRGPPCPADTSGRVLAAGQTSCLAAVESMIYVRETRSHQVSIP